jgi:hypothetical protein
MLHWPTISSIGVSSLIQTISLGQILMHIQTLVCSSTMNQLVDFQLTKYSSYKKNLFVFIFFYPNRLYKTNDNDWLLINVTWEVFQLYSGQSCYERIVDLQLPMQSVPITTTVVSLNPQYPIKWCTYIHVQCSKICVNQTFWSYFEFEIDRCSVYTG